MIKAGFLTKGISKQDLIIIISLFLLGIATRIPFANRMIYNSDSARFALAMEHYDVTQMRPHAPGYILYVASAKLVDLFIHNARVSLVSVSIIASALAIISLYVLAGKMYGRSSGVISSLFLLSSPLFWFNGEMPLTYALEGLFSVIFAFTCYKILTGEEKWLLVSAIVLGLATGVRQNAIILFLPLWLYTIRKCSFKHVLVSFVVFGVTCLTWFTPMIALTGGLKEYFTAIDAHFKAVVLHPLPLLVQITMRVKIFATFMIYSLSVGLIPICYYSGRFFRIPSIVEDLRLKFLLLWFVPAILFFIGLNIWNPGHVVVILPPLFICFAESIKGLSMDLEEGMKRVIVKSPKFLKRIFSYKAILVSLFSLLFLINLYIFLLQDTPVSYAAIQKNDSHLTELIQLTKDNFPPEKAMIIAFSYSTQAGLYLPDYLVYCPFPLMFSSAEVPIAAQNVYISFRHETTPKTFWTPSGFRINPIDVPDGVETVILWEKQLAQFYQSPNRPLREMSSNLNDTKIYFFNVKPQDKIHYDYHFLSVK